MTKLPKKHFKSIFISDVHFGYNINRSDLLNDFLKHHSCDNLYLVGDIFDFWVLKNKMTWKYDDILAIRQILNKIKAGSKVYYIIGNHDEILREFLDEIDFEGIDFANEVEHIGVDGKRYLVIHGDLFDSSSPVWAILSHIGNSAYMFSLWLNRIVNKCRKMFNMEEWSLSLYLKRNVKAAANYIGKFESHMIDYCHQKKYNGAICGHIHSPCIRNVDDLIYMNCGDWVETCSALVEHDDGKFEIIDWLGKNK